MKTSPTIWAGRILTGLFALFMLGASIAPKFLDTTVDEAAMAHLGWPIEHYRLIGIIELSCLVLYLFPRTAVMGAALMTGLLGGAVATHLRVNDPMFTHTLFGVYLGLIMWGGLWLRDDRLRAVFPLRAAVIE